MEISVSNNNFIVVSSSGTLTIPIDAIEKFTAKTAYETVVVFYRQGKTNRYVELKVSEITNPVFADFNALVTWCSTNLVEVFDVSDLTDTTAIIPPYDDYRQIITFVPELPLCEDDITAFTANSITDNTQSWTVDEYVDKVVEIKRNGQTQYGIVLSNTTDTLTFDKDLAWLPEVGDDYCILDTEVLTVPDNKKDLPLIVGAYPTNNTGAIILPTITNSFERMMFDFYIESLTSTNKIVLVCRGSQGFFSNQYKFGELVNDKETISLVAHFNTTNVHYDVVSTNGTKRYITASIDADQTLLTNLLEQPTGADADVTIMLSKRFTKRVVDGIVWYEYNSLFKSAIQANYNAIIDKSGAAGAGDVYIGWQKYTAETDSTETLGLIGQTRFGNSDGTTTIDVMQPVELSYGDRLCPYTRREAGTIKVLAGSSIIIKEI